MNAPPLFDRIADALERGSSLSRLEARGALRLRVQKLGLDPKELRAKDLGTLLELALPKDLEERGVADARALCGRILREVTSSGAAAAKPAGAPSPFDWAAQALETQASLSRLAARGLLRHILKDAGLVPEQTTRGQLEVVLSVVAPKHLRGSALPDADGICMRILSQLQTAVVEEPTGAETPEEVFDRLGRR
jgi:hypothetical protein